MCNVFNMLHTHNKFTVKPVYLGVSWVKWHVFCSVALFYRSIGKSVNNLLGNFTSSQSLIKMNFLVLGERNLCPMKKMNGWIDRNAEYILTWLVYIIYIYVLNYHNTYHKDVQISKMSPHAVNKRRKWKYTNESM